MEIVFIVENKESLKRQEQSFTLEQVQNGLQQEWLNTMKVNNYNLVSGDDDGMAEAVLDTLAERKDDLVKLLNTNILLKEKDFEKDIITIHAYVDQLVDNTDGVHDSYDNCWMVVPATWAEDMAKKNQFKDLETFFDEYTYDDADEWLDKAIKDGVLLECGIGSIILKRPVH